jgi:hypothetical protein
MSRITKLSFTSLNIFTLLALVACSSSSTPPNTTATVVTDTLGWKYDVGCSGGLCILSPRGTLQPKTCESGGGTESFILVPEPLLSIYAAIVPASGIVQLSAAEPSRPVACVSDADCLPDGMVATGASYACTNGLCQCSNSLCASKGPGGNPLVYDILTLCQADLQWPDSCPYITSPRYANRIAEVGALCGAAEYCAFVPADCRQLTPPADGGGQPTPVTPLDGGAQPTPVDSSVDSGL